MNPEEANYSATEQMSPAVDGRHPFDQGVSAAHWDGVMTDIDARTPRFPELNIEISETEILPSEGILFDSEVDAPKAEERTADGVIARARKAWATLGETARIPELKPLLAPALALTVAACNAGGGTTPATSSSRPEATPSPIVSQAPTAEASKTPFPGTGNTGPEVTPTPKPTPTETPEPTPTPKPLEMATIVNGKHPAVKFAKVKEDTETAYEKNPQGKTIFNTYAQQLKDCHVAPNVPGGNLDQEDACEKFVVWNYKAYLGTGDIAFYNLAKESYNSFISKYGLGKSFKATMDEYLKVVGLIQ